MLLKTRSSQLNRKSDRQKMMHEDCMLSMQKLREERDEAELSVFEQFTEDQRQLRLKVEKLYQREEEKLKVSFLGKIRSVHDSFSEKERTSELRLTQKCLTSPIRGES